ncbi:MAG TPA: hypothetical protein VIV60_29865 [Polyangiaceae bacterium]
MIAQSQTVKIQLLERTDEYVIVAWRRLVLLIWLGDASVTGIERSRKVFEEWAKAQARGAALLIVVPPHQAGPPDEKTREAMQRTSVSPSGKLLGMGTLFQAEGFIAASIRSIMMRLNILSGKNALNVFGSTAAAAAWATALLVDPELTPAGLTEAIRQARER